MLAAAHPCIQYCVALQVIGYFILKITCKNRAPLKIPLKNRGRGPVKTQQLLFETSFLPDNFKIFGEVH